MMSSDGRGAGVFNRRDGGGGETDYYGEALSGMIRRRSSGRLNGRLAAATEDAAPALRRQWSRPNPTVPGGIMSPLAIPPSKVKKDARL